MDKTLEKIRHAANRRIEKGDDRQRVVMSLFQVAMELFAKTCATRPLQAIITKHEDAPMTMEWPQTGYQATIVPRGSNPKDEALRAAGQQFLAYRDAHTKKGTDEAMRKAGVNDMMAGMCFSAVGDATDTEQNGYVLGLFPISTDDASFLHAVETLVENGYERDVDHTGMMRALMKQTIAIGECHGWNEDTRIVISKNPKTGDLDYFSVPPGTPYGQEVVVRPSREPQERDSVLSGPVTAAMPLRTLREIATDLIELDASGDVGRAVYLFGERMNSVLDQIENPGEPMDRREVCAYITAKSTVARNRGDTDLANVLGALVGELAAHLEEQPIDMQRALREFYRDTHERNVKAGWWTDLSNGSPKKRNVGELFVLIVTELAEAYNAYLTGEPDDKLPQYPGLGVELGDVQIRLADFCGALAAGRIVENTEASNPGNRFFQAITDIAAEYEIVRKTPAAKGDDETGDMIEPQDVPEMIIAKLEFNATRADHKPENRVKEGGKQT